jgi:hypothetical protein
VSQSVSFVSTARQLPHLSRKEPKGVQLAAAISKTGSDQKLTAKQSPFAITRMQEFSLRTKPSCAHAHPPSLFFVFPILCQTDVRIPGVSCTQHAICGPQTTHLSNEYQVPPRAVPHADPVPFCGPPGRVRHVQEDVLVRLGGHPGRGRVQLSLNVRYRHLRRLLAFVST